MPFLSFSDDYFRTTSHGSEYYFPKVTRRGNVTSFNEICQQSGGYLAEVNTEAEYTFLLNFLKTSIPEGRQSVILGATDTAEDGKWVYMTSGKPVTFTRWYQGYRDDMGSRGQQYNCLHLFWGSDDEGMHDWKCTAGRFACERDIGNYIYVTKSYGCEILSFSMPSVIKVLSDFKL